MTTDRTDRSVSRRAALAGLGAGGLGLALAATARGVAAQDATPGATAGHPIVGTWVIDRDVTGTTEVPVVVVFTADGGFIDPGQGVAGVWEPTGPRSAAKTIIPFVDGGAGGYVVVRATWEVDAGGDTMSGPASVTVVAPDGTVVATSELSSRATRLRVDPIENGGTALAGFPTWTPAPPATPAP
jgi:predicted lipoprotein